MSRWKTVLLVDDHPLFRRGLATTIDERTALRVVAEADDGRSALTLAGIHRPDVTVIDLALPDFGGLTLVGELRRAVPDVDCVIMTLYNDTALLDRALELGVAGYLLKSDGAETVRACLEGASPGRPFVSPGVSVDPPGPPRAGAVAGLGWLDELTDRERQVLHALARSLTSRQIAAALGISVRTVQNHRARAAIKLELAGPHALLRFALDNAAALERRDRGPGAEEPDRRRARE